ncbi:MAG: hypothetical protein DDT21_02737 [Syntrophomonadaceae bacterium]|nr:hypothetical protein [Bacillota bacterium]
MFDLEDKLGRGLAKLQAGQEAAKKKLELIKELSRLRKEMKEAEDAKGRLYFNMGLRVYYLLRQGAVQDEVLFPLSEEMVVLDKKMWQLSEQIARLSVRAEEAKICSNCSQPIKSEDKFCGHCGQQVSKTITEEEKPKICPTCTYNIPVQAQFCPCCGHGEGS